MNKRKTLNILCILFQTIQVIIFCVVPCLSILPSTYHTKVYNEYVGTQTMLQVVFKDEHIWLGVTLGIMIFNIALCIISLKSRNVKKDGIIHTVTPIFILILAFLCFGEGMILVWDYKTTFLSPVNVIYWGICILLIILAIAKRSANVIEETEEPKDLSENKVEKEVVEQPVKIDEVEQIRKYKDLLDSGAITQEEYDTKKKQILGLEDSVKID